LDYLRGKRFSGIDRAAGGAAPPPVVCADEAAVAISDLVGC
jgi:hypothetical protein